MTENTVYDGLEFTPASCIWLGIEILFYSIHVSVIIVLIAGFKKLFNNCFYIVVIIICVEDVIHYIVIVLFVLRFPQLGLWTSMYLNNPWIASAGYTFSRALMYSQLFGHTIISFNRFTLFWTPYKFKKLWSKPWYLFLIFVVPICCVLPGITDPGKIEYHSGIIISALKLPENYNLANTLTYIVYIGNTAVSFILSMLALLKYRCLKSAGRLSSVKIKDRRLLMYSIIVLAFQCVKLCYLYLRPLFIKIPSVYKILMDAIPVLYLLHAFIGSLSVVLICKSTRRTYLRFYLGVFCRVFYHYPNDLIVPSNSVRTHSIPPPAVSIKIADLPENTIKS